MTKQRKIDELEAQLNEAEDVITDLRSELRWVMDKLEKVKNNPLQPVNGQTTKEDAYSQEDVKVEAITPSISNSHLEAVTACDMENSPLNLRILDNRCCSTIQKTENSSDSHLEPDVHTPNIVSTIMRSKEPEPFRNGCTQRIRALESNLLNGKLHQLGNEDCQCTPLMIEAIDKAVGKCAAPAPPPKTKNMDVTNKFSGGEVKKLVKPTSRRRKTRFGKARASTRRSCPDQPKIASCLSSAPSCCKTSSVNGNVKSKVSAHIRPSIKADNRDNAKICSNLNGKLQQKRSFNEEEIKISQKQKENVGLQSRDSAPTSIMSAPGQLINPCQASSVVNRSVIYSFAKHGNVKSSEAGLRTADNEAKMKPLLRLDPGLTLIRSGVDPVSGSKNVTVSVKALNKCGLVQKTEEKDAELKSESALVKPDGGAVENSMDVCSELGGEVVNEPVLSDSKDAKSSIETDESPSEPDFNRVLKYTFQRKRKKDSMSNSGENTSPDKTIVKRRVTEKENDSQEPEKPTLIKESSRHSRRVAQVARQVGSFSSFPLFS